MIGRAELEAMLTVESVRGLQILQLSLGVGVVLFCGAIVFFWWSGEPVESAPPGVVPMLTLAQFAVAVASFAVSAPLFRSRLGAVRNAGSPEEGLEALRGAWMLRVAIPEGAALFGAAVAFLAVMNRVVDAHPLYWINLATPAVFVLFVARTFPTRDGLMELLRDRLTG